MPSPFPGMNPYLEQPDGWHEFHEVYCGTIIDDLVGRAPDRYVVRGGENVYIRELSADERGRLIGRPDAFVAGPVGAVAVTSSPIATALRFPDVDVFRETSVLLVDHGNRNVITAIEVLSPSNKDPGQDRTAYLRKRLRYLQAGTNLVEIDLLRGGRRPPMEPSPPTSDYCVIVGRASEWPAARHWPIGLRDPLPTVPVPLRPGEADLDLDLQRLLHLAYDRRRMDKFIYDAAPDPPLSADDAAWAQALIGRPHVG